MDVPDYGTGLECTAITPTPSEMVGQPRPQVPGICGILSIIGSLAITLSAVALYFAFLFRIKAVPPTVLPWAEFVYRLLPPPTTGIVNGVLMLTLAAIVRGLYRI